MSCGYCYGGKSMTRDSCSEVSIDKEKDVYRIFYADGYRCGLTNPIRFCPMCGERFPEVDHDSLESIKADMTLGACAYAKKRGIGRGVRASDEQANCSCCEWANVDKACGWLMRDDLADRLGKLLDEEEER